MVRDVKSRDNRKPKKPYIGTPSPANNPALMGIHRATVLAEEAGKKLAAEHKKKKQKVISEQHAIIDCQSFDSFKTPPPKPKQVVRGAVGEPSQEFNTSDLDNEDFTKADAEERYDSESSGSDSSEQDVSEAKHPQQKSESPLIDKRTWVDLCYYCHHFCAIIADNSTHVTLIIGGQCSESAASSLGGRFRQSAVFRLHQAG